MDEWLMKILVFITALQIINTIINVVHKLEVIKGPPTHVAIAILSMIILFGYSGILNSLFLQRKFSIGRIVYLVVAFTCQTIILVLAILAWTQTITYFLSIAIIHGITGFIVAINFVCAVFVVDEQQKEIKENIVNQKKKKSQKAYQMVNKYYKYESTTTGRDTM